MGGAGPATNATPTGAVLIPIQTPDSRVAWIDAESSAYRIVPADEVAARNAPAPTPSTQPEPSATTVPGETTAPSPAAGAESDDVVTAEHESHGMPALLVWGIGFVVVAPGSIGAHRALTASATRRLSAALSA